MIVSRQILCLSYTLGYGLNLELIPLGILIHRAYLTQKLEIQIMSSQRTSASRPNAVVLSLLTKRIDSKHSRASNFWRGTIIAPVRNQDTRELSPYPYHTISSLSRYPVFYKYQTAQSLVVFPLYSRDNRISHEFN